MNYRENNGTSCLCLIYKLSNKINGKIYVGQTWKSLHSRWKNGAGYKNCIYLERAINKYGANNFTYEILTVCGTQKTADYWETYFIDRYHSLDRKIGYNIKSGGSTGKLSDETKKKLSDANIGKILTDEHKNKIGISNTGKKRSNKQNKDASERAKQNGITPPFNGPHSAEARSKISEFMKNRIVSQETRQLLSIVNSGENNPRYGHYILSDRQMQEICSSELSSRKLAKIYGVGKTTVNAIRKRNKNNV